MLKRLRVEGFNSLGDVEVEFPALTVLFGSYASGKSNLLDALLVLSRLATERTLANALAALYPKGSEKKRFIDATLLAVQG
jgi:AAA15 family ATPase/GTPase